MEQGLTMHVPQVSSLDGMACSAYALREHQLGVSVSEGAPFLSSDPLIRPGGAMASALSLPAGTHSLPGEKTGRTQ